MNCMRIDPNYDTSKNGKHRKELKAVLRSIYDSLGRYPGYRTVSKWRVNSCGHCGCLSKRKLNFSTEPTEISDCTCTTEISVSGFSAISKGS